MINLLTTYRHQELPYCETMHVRYAHRRQQYSQYTLTSPTGKKKGKIQKPSHRASFTSHPPWCRYWSLLSLLYFTPTSTADMRPKNICTGHHCVHIMQVHRNTPGTQQIKHTYKVAHAEPVDSLLTIPLVANIPSCLMHNP